MYSNPLNDETNTLLRENVEINGLTDIQRKLLNFKNPKEIDDFYFEKFEQEADKEFNYNSLNSLNSKISKNNELLIRINELVSYNNNLIFLACCLLLFIIFVILCRKRRKIRKLKPAILKS